MDLASPAVSGTSVYANGLKRNQNTVTFSCKGNSQNAFTIVSSRQRIKIQFYIFSIIIQIHERQRRYKNKRQNKPAITYCVQNNTGRLWEVNTQTYFSHSTVLYSSLDKVIRLKKQRLLADLRSTNERLKILRYRNLKNCGHQNHKETLTMLTRPQERLSYVTWCSLSGCKRIKVSLTK